MDILVIILATVVLALIGFLFLIAKSKRTPICKSEEEEDNKRLQEGLQSWQSTREDRQSAAGGFLP